MLLITLYWKKVKLSRYYKEKWYNEDVIKDKRCGKNDILDPLLDPQTEDLRGKIRKIKIQKSP